MLHQNVESVSRIVSNKIRLEFRVHKEERRDRRGEEKRGSSAIGSGDVALLVERRESPRGVRLPDPLRPFGPWVFNDLPVA